MKLKMLKTRNDFILFISGRFFLILSIFIFGVPLYFTVVNSFKDVGDIVSSPFSLPINFTLKNFKYIFTSPNVPLFEMYKNTFIITVVSLAMIIVTCPLAGYYIARTKTKFSTFILMFFMAGLLVPPQLTLVPLVRMFIALKIIGTLMGLVFLYIAGSTIATLMYSRFIITIPYSLEESAFIDGASQGRIFWKIVFPLLKPCTATVVTFLGLFIWNNFMTPLIFLRGKLTITMGIYAAIGPYSADWGLVLGFVIISALPILILYYKFQRWFIAGLTAGAIKS